MSAYDCIPADLRARRQWVIWRAEVREGKATKVPYRADGSGRASTTEPSGWSTFDAAVSAAESPTADGVGFVFAADDPYVGVDLDVFDADAAAIVGTLDSYSEWSVSGRGVHVIVRGALNGHPRHRRGPLEVYEAARFFVMTGEHVRGAPTSVEDRQQQLDAVLAHFLPVERVASLAVAPVEADDRELLERAFQARNGFDFRRLYEGDWSSYRSQSEADLALCSMLAFWTGRDPARIDDLFRSSGLCRSKWKRDDYRRGTIEKAVAGTSDVYQPPERRPTAAAPSAGELGSVEHASNWLERASDLLAEPDPGPTPFLIDELIVDQAIGAIQGAPKLGKTWVVLEVATSVVTGRPAFGRFAVPTPGPVMIVLEESGREALHRRLDMLVRGRAIDPSTLAELRFAANRRVRLDDEAWQGRLLAAASEIRPRAILLDPLARLKGNVDEDRQKEMAPLLDFLRLLRDESGACVAFVHHTGHGGSHLRGSSDLEGYWESKLTLRPGDHGATEVTAEHREAESGVTLAFRLGFDHTSRSVRLSVVDTQEEGAPRDLKRELLHNLRATGDRWRTATEIATKAQGGVGAKRDAVDKTLAALEATGAVERRQGPEGRQASAICYRAVVPTAETTPDNPSQGAPDGLSPGTPPSLKGGGTGTTGQLPRPEPPDNPSRRRRALPRPR